MSSVNSDSDKAKFLEIFVKILIKPKYWIIDILSKDLIFFYPMEIN